MDAVGERTKAQGETVRETGVRLACDVLRSRGRPVPNGGYSWEEPTQSGTLARYTIRLAASFDEAVEMQMDWNRRMRAAGKFDDAVEHALVLFRADGAAERMAREA